MRIGEVASSAGISVETVRFYENRGLICQPSRPAAGGYRDYPTAIVYRIGFIRSAQQLGFSLEEINELLELESGPDAQCTDVRDRAESKLHDVAARIDSLNRIKAALQALIDACPGKGPAKKCSILGEIKRGDLHITSVEKGE